MAKVKDLMIPVGEYVAVGEGATLMDVFVALDEDRKGKQDKAHAHRDVLVVGDDGEVAGKVTMVDVFHALEPNYRKVLEGATDHDTLTREYVSKIFKEFDLWTEPIRDLCRKAAGLSVAKVMHVPSPGEFVEEDDDLEKAAHRYVVGVCQPLLVRSGGKVTGVLRFGDLFEVVREHMLACKA